jgi:hypothetical protein
LHLAKYFGEYFEAVFHGVLTRSLRRDFAARRGDGER